ncbi:nuclease domain-containing protein [Bacillus sp. JCM 19041]|uniref:nuclease domain-containing protein n=1 Tax=Bacillus sp. JCM 19041 TaxID=1460637 RepID=UPI0006D00CD2
MTQFSTVLQMGPGYRDVLQVYLTVSKGLALFGQQYQMSVKNVAELYEYWTFLKVGQILSKRYLSISQDVVSATSNGLFINLDASKSASRLFEHPLTGEKIKLTYQKREWNPTTTQLPDIVLSVTKKGMNQSFNYVFDAKYRIDFAAEESYYGRKYQIPGPMEEDINTMHRYRDAIVHKRQGPYEQTAFGAYVLFPFGFEEGYRQHQFFKSIEEVNIGGLPFLPSATKLVEELIETIIEKSPAELHDEGILPQGSKHKWHSELDEFVLITNVATIDNYKEILHQKECKIPIRTLPRDWRKATHLALYVGKKVHKANGVICYGRIEDVSIREQQMTYSIMAWQSIDPIKPVQYGVANTTMTTLGQLKEAKELPELFMKSKEETLIWKLLRRVSDKVKIDLTRNELDYAEGLSVLQLEISR